MQICKECFAEYKFGIPCGTCPECDGSVVQLLELEADDAPQKGSAGAYVYRLYFPLKDGQMLKLIAGEKTRSAFAQMLMNERMDDAAEASQPNHLSL